MNACKYHPLAPATYHCPRCRANSCDSCIDDSRSHSGEPRCFICASELTSLGAINTAEPFWRRLHESFRYPLTSQALTLIIGIAVLSSVLSYLPLPFLWLLVLSGAFMRYCFSCLESTARGAMTAPDISTAYEGGVRLLLQLLAILVIAGVAVGACAYLLGPVVASLLGLLLIAGLPAIIINFAMTESLANALNPLKMMALISAVGLPYGLLLAFIMIMAASVSLISGLLGYQVSVVTYTLQSVVSNYYMVVVFHLMGYMIFQYQGELGFTARADDEEIHHRSEKERLLAEIDVNVKTGDYAKALRLFEHGIDKFSNDSTLFDGYFELLLALADTARLQAFVPRYLNVLANSGRDAGINHMYKRVLGLLPDYMPNNARARYLLALSCNTAGDPLSAAKLLNGLHKAFPDYPQLGEAYALMARALDALPNMAQRAAQYRAMSAQLNAQRQAKAPPKPRPAPKARAPRGDFDSLREEQTPAETPATPPAPNTNPK